jgi:hypothetical protein
MFGVSTGDPYLDWIVNNASAVGILGFVVVALIRGWLVPGRENERVIEERNRALELVYAQAEATARALEVAQTTKAK